MKLNEEKARVESTLAESRATLTALTTELEKSDADVLVARRRRDENIRIITSLTGEIGQQEELHSALLQKKHGILAVVTNSMPGLDQSPRRVSLMDIDETTDAMNATGPRE